MTSPQEITRAGIKIKELEAKLEIAKTALETIVSWNCAGEGIGYDMSDLAEKALKELNND